MVSARDIAEAPRKAAKKAAKKPPTISNVRMKCPGCKVGVYPIEGKDTLECPECGVVTDKLSVVKREAKSLVQKAVGQAVPGLTDDTLDAYASAVSEQAAKDASYQEQEDEDWEDLASLQGVAIPGEQSEARGIIQDRHGAKRDKGILASQTRLVSRDQAAAMMELRVMAKHYPDFGIEDAPEWLEAYNVSLDGKGRQEDVEILRGNVSLAPPVEPVRKGW